MPFPIATKITNTAYNKKSTPTATEAKANAINTGRIKNILLPFYCFHPSNSC